MQAEEQTQAVEITKVVEIIPPSQLPTLREDLATLTKYEGELAAIKQQCRDLTVNDEQSRRTAGELNARWKSIVKDAENLMAPHKKLINDFKKDYMLEPENRVSNRGQEIQMIIQPKMSDYDRAEEIRTAAEKKRLQDIADAENKRLADEKLAADKAAADKLKKEKVADAKRRLASKEIGKREYARLLREAGEESEATMAQSEAEAEEIAKNPPKVKVKSTVPKVAGNVRRVNYSASCSDESAFLWKFVEAAYRSKFGKDKNREDYELAKRLREMISVSNQKLSDEARSKIKTHDEDDRHPLTPAEFKALYPFVELHEERTY